MIKQVRECTTKLKITNEKLKHRGRRLLGSLMNTRHQIHATGEAFNSSNARFRRLSMVTRLSQR